jgi:hypothetical protein
MYNAMDITSEVASTMARMIRKQVYIEPGQEDLLKRRSRELGVSEAALIRRGIDEVAHRSSSAAFDRTAWEEELAFMEERARMKVPRPRSWTREELYEERLSAFR